LSRPPKMNMLVASTSRAARPTMARLSPLCMYRGYADNTNANKTSKDDDGDIDHSAFMLATATRIESTPSRKLTHNVPNTAPRLIKSTVSKYLISFYSWPSSS
jgi:hypothetical protein